MSSRDIGKTPMRMDTPAGFTSETQTEGLNYAWTCLCYNGAVGCRTGTDAGRGDTRLGSEPVIYPRRLLQRRGRNDVCRSVHVPTGRFAVVHHVCLRH